MLDIKTLETWLWDAACSIRGSVDAPKFKDYILPLIFIKRLSDVFEDEIKKLSEEFGDEKTAFEIVAKDHSVVRFYIPKNATWPEIRKQTTKIGEKLTDTVRVISKENQKLQGVIDIVDFNATVSGQRIIDDGKLSNLIEIISRHRLGLMDTEPDILGRAYEYLLRKFAEGQGQSAGEFYTPKEVGWIMSYILNPEQGQEVYDPACGSGGLLIKCQLALKEKERKISKPLRLYGQEQIPLTYAMAKMNMFIHDMEGDIVIGDTLRNPKFLEGSRLKTFDLVVANPMWNQDGYTEEFYEADTFNRFEYGYPPASSADWGWVQHMFASLNKNGKAAIVLDTGVLSRGSGLDRGNKEKEIRAEFIKNDWIEGILLLPPNLFYNTMASGIILFINKNKSTERKNKIIFINASKEFEKGTPKNFLPDESIKKIVYVFSNWIEEKGFSKIEPIDEVLKRDFCLSPVDYITEMGHIEFENISETIEEIHSMERVEQQLNPGLLTACAKIGYQYLQKNNFEQHGEWYEAEFGEVVDFIRGISWRKSEEDKNGIPVIAIPNIYGEVANFNIKYFIKKNIPKDKLLNNGDILLVGSSGSLHNIGRCATIKGIPFQVLTYASFLIKASPKKEKIDHEYLHHLLKSNLVNFPSCSKQAADGKFNLQLDRLKKHKIILPKQLEQQRAIAKFMSRIQDSIDFAYSKANNLEKLKSVIRLYLFSRLINLKE
ncbi:MAG: N-6 DNA methylase [Elusimicrobiota bacterium]